MIYWRFKQQFTTQNILKRNFKTLVLVSYSTLLSVNKIIAEKKVL